MGDLVVVVPGIQGTQLFKDDKPVWALSGKALWNGLRTLGDNVKGLALPADIGDEHPGDGVEPRGLMPDLHGIPGVGPFIGGYSDLSKWLRETVGLHAPTEAQPGNLLEFGYDWRLSNRYNALLLTETAERELKRWRDDGHRKAKLVFYCHSMGGLIARYYLEVLGGAEDTRTLITVGTPHQGSLKALANLVNGRKIGIGPIKLDVASLARSFPAAYQLLPSYRCVVEEDERKDLLTVLPSKLERHRVADALAFHAEINSAVASNGVSPYRFRMVVGTRQPTHATARLNGDRVEPLWTIDGDNNLGDGTVSRFASLPVEVDPTDLRQVSSAKRHGWLQQSEGILDDFYGILTARPRRYMSDTPDIQRAPGLEMPEVVEPGRPLTVRANSLDDDMLLFATLTGPDGEAGIGTRPLHNLGEGNYEVEMEPPGEGVYTVTLGGGRTAKFDPISEAVLVAGVEQSD